MKNLTRTSLQNCNTDKVTGYSRTGKCAYFPNDSGAHIVCAVMTDSFLKFTKLRGNDLSTPRDGFPGLKSGDKWCICAGRWLEAYNADPKHAPYIVGASTSVEFLRYISFQKLKPYII